jgi:hypothetical protein
MTENHEIILSMDANLSYDPDTTVPAHPLVYTPGIPTLDRTHDGKLATLIATCGLVDPLARQHSNRPIPPSHERGSDRIDFMLVSPNLMSAVLSSGCLSSHAIFNSDHRAYFLDFDSTLLFSDPAYEIARPTQRHLRLLDPRLVDHYRILLHDQLQFHKVLDKITDLQQAIATESWTDMHTKMYQTLDNIITESMLYAERNTGRSFSKKYDWLPELKHAVQAHRYWRLQLKKKRGGIVSDSCIEHLRTTALIEPHSTLSEAQILEALKLSSTNLKEPQRLHKTLRSNYLEDLAEAIVLSTAPNLVFDSMSHVKADRKHLQIKRLLSREASRRFYRKLGGLLHTQSTKGLGRVDIPDEAASSTSTGNPNDPKTWKGPWKSVTNPMDLAKVVKEINRQQYHQAHNTPFGSGPLADQVGRRGDTLLAQQLLQGVLPDITSTLLPETQCILKTLARDYPIAMATATITDKEFQDSYKAAKEATSSSPSGRHIGHYKAILKDPTLTALHATMMSIPFQVGIVPDRWNRVTDIMLEKTAGDSRCHRLRIIALFESDLNHAKRILIGRKLLHFIEDNHMLSDMQLGSRPGKRCISAVLKKVLAHDYLCLTKQTAAFVENDATGCYDRLMNNIILMILKKFGIPKTVTSCLGSLWDNTVHLIKTIYGTSHITYNSTPDMPLYGPGQGSMCGPTFWILCYWLIVSSLDPSITSAQYISVCKSIIVDMTGVSFVDDTGLGVTSTYIWDTNLSTEENYREEIRHVIQKIHLLAQHWEKCLFSTGGCINLQKSFWYLVAWKWKNHKATLATIGQTPVELFLTSGYFTIQEQLPRIEPTQAFKTLGVYISASGCLKWQMEILHTSSQHYYDHIQNSTLSPQEAYMSYALYLHPRLSYPLPCTSFSSAQCRRLQAPAFAALLPKLRLNRHSPRSVLFSGPKYGSV